MVKINCGTDVPKIGDIEREEKNMSKENIKENIYNSNNEEKKTSTYPQENLRVNQNEGENEKNLLIKKMKNKKLSKNNEKDEKILNKIVLKISKESEVTFKGNINKKNKELSQNKANNSNIIIIINNPEQQQFKNNAKSPKDSKRKNNNNDTDKIANVNISKDINIHNINISGNKKNIIDSKLINKKIIKKIIKFNTKIKKISLRNVYDLKNEKYKNKIIINSFSLIFIN